MCAEDSASTAAFSIGRDGTFITGTDLLIDGGVIAAIDRPPLPTLYWR